MNLLLPSVILAFAGLALAQEDKIEIARPAYSVFHEFGNIVSGSDRADLEFENNFLQRSGVWMTLKATRNDRLSLDAILGGIYWNPTFNENTSSESDLRYFAAMAPRASITYIFGDLAKPAVLVETGIFGYKYNDNSRNLGEYMFRSISYPSQVFTGGLNWVGVDRAQVTGMRITAPMGDVLSHDVVLNFETTQIPYYDLSLTYMAKAKVGQALKVGAGVQFSRLLPIKPDATNPDAQFNRYFTFNDTTYIDNPDYYAQRKVRSSTAADSAQFSRGETVAAQIASMVVNGMTMDAALDSLESFYGVTTASSYDHYDASAIKTVLTFSFDPKHLLGGMPAMGPNDMILYGEAAVLGWKNYPVIYENRMERTVAMLGFNVPTFRLLDVLALEVEWFGSKQPNSNEYSQLRAPKNDETKLLEPTPQPSIYGFTLPQGYAPEDWEEDDIKWSVFARRSLVKGLTLDVQAASDNARGWVFPSGRRYWNFFRSPSDWYWMMKVTASI
jgi:hypothetical protein